MQNIIFASTSAIYENNDATQNAFSENLNTSPRLFYSLSKKMAEEAKKAGDRVKDAFREKMNGATS